MDFRTRYTHLNAAQKKAVDTIDGPVIVIAGPGTGKTELLSMRAANILKKTDTLPENILCLTFTESGANAMRRRLASIIGADAYKVAIHTFHSFGTEIINQNGQFFYHGAHFRPADDISSYEILRGIFDQIDHKNPLAAMTNGEYTYLDDTITVVSELKRSGLTGDELRKILAANAKVIERIQPHLQALFANRLSKTTLQHVPTVIQELGLIDTPSPLSTITPLQTLISDSLQDALDTAEEQESTKPLTAWRNHWLKKNEKGDFVLKTHERQTKLLAVADVYDHYLQNMHTAELFDFDDMILRVVHAMEVFPELRFNLQERFQYIMVDEFQDTNMAQMRILFALTNNEVHNGRPNILAVGDDDQAIYSFQGADIGNIHTFRETFVQTELIVLTDNYRSTAEVLEKARAVITQGTDRLENHLPEINKSLQPHAPKIADAVDLVELPSLHDERTWLVESIQHALSSGVPPASIAVLARRHHELVALLPYFVQAGVTINYERRENVLDQEPLKMIELVSAILVRLFEQRHDEANSLLPELLAHPAFGFDPHLIWHISLAAQTNRQSWMEIMAVTPEFQPLHSWLVTQAQLLSTTPLEYMIDAILGLPHDTAIESIGSFTSPLFHYYFGPDKLTNKPDIYLIHLEGLQTIRQKLREYQPEQTPTLQSFLEFIRLHRRLGRSITSVRRAGDQLESAVHLMTAHKSKGLEFDRVYIIGAVDTSWGERVRSRSRLISYPENIPLAPAGDTYDERLRLFFVAMTRAKKQLIISYASTDDNGKGLQRAGFLLDDIWQATAKETKTSIDTLTNESKLQWYQPVIQPLSPDMQTLLAPKLETYKLSSTHLANFLDVTRGGPQSFLIRNLLRFPQAIHPNAGYGSAIHATLQRTHAHLAATGKHRPLEDILHDYEQHLRDQRLADKDFTAFLQKGGDTLTAFLKEKYESFSPTQKVELNFASQAVQLGKARLTGSLDLVDFNDDRSIVVTDYKTGKASHNWTGKTDYEKIKLHRYKQQLMFYHLLVSRSRDYRKYTFEKGVLQFVEPTTTGDIVALEATFATDELVQFARLVERVWDHIIDLKLPDTSHFEPTYKGILAFEQSIIDSL